ncbi:hypothetical protein ACIA5G_06020 [Amycolatopsis sp. NPDC051758]|uniref:hypothetical protein n=1 Tax=Amycolatopsis sp. NPDC051758 TaxID=3363935 RepID=UPI0037B0BFD2
MTGPEHYAAAEPVATDTAAVGPMADIAGVDRAARALAVNDGKNWGNAEVRNHYRGLALAAVAAYLGTPAAVVEVSPA